MMKRIQSPLLVMLAMLTVTGAQSKHNGEERGHPVMPAQANAKWQTECGGCHVAFAPGLLPAASWKNVMSGLAKHFGSDASLTPQDATEISNFLVKNASNRWTASTAPLQITESSWFKAKHLSGEINPNVWNRPSVKNKSNCIACHGGANKGLFDERTVRIPK